MSAGDPVSLQDIIFPSAHTGIHNAISEIKRSKLGISNRLRSIAKDAAFVEQAAAALQLPLIANERCGSWYINPEIKSGSAYFKSTDGHFGQWSFSLRRLNLHLLEIIGRHTGCIIVDSTRRGKSMPDALSKTIPIWIAVLNRCLFPDLVASHALATPSNVVSASEHAQIEARIQGFVEDVEGLKLNIDQLRRYVGRPLKPIWLTPGTNLDEIVVSSESTVPICLCTASSRISFDITDDVEYVQGAADDHESWACGLDAVSFWQHRDVLLSANEDGLPELIREIMSGSNSTGSRRLTLIQPTSCLYITNNSGLSSQLAGTHTILYCAASTDEILAESARQSGTKLIHLKCGQAKNGSRQLRNELSKIENLDLSGKIICSCETGKDLAIGVALAILCKYFASDGSPASAAIADKTQIKQRLSWIMVSMPDAAPSRATLQSVNAFLMS